MNIIEIAKYLEDGNKVRIESWKKDQYIFMVDLKILAMPPICHDAEFYAITTDDMLSTDWEIFDESKAAMESIWEEVKNELQSKSEWILAAEGYNLFKLTWEKAEKHFTHQKD